MTVLVAFFGASAAGGYCHMAAASGAVSDSGVSPHDCCKTGLSGKVPSCCHAGNAQAQIAMVKGSVMAQPTTWVPAVSLSIPVERLRVAGIRLACLSHGPPLTVLRV